MNKMLDKLLVLPIRWRFCIFTVLTVAIAFLFYQHLFSQQQLQIDRYDSQLAIIKNRVKNYLDNQADIAAKKELFAVQRQRLSDMEDKLKNVDQQAPELTLLLAAKNTNVKPEQIQISAVAQDELGEYYLIEVTIRSSLEKISQFLTYLIIQPEFAVWQQLTITKHIHDFSVILATRYYVELSDETSN